ncbi:MAG: hypothetical protein LBP19_08185 [Treponema sp.]|jgi:hypothetical protein|nr:hypothetical protein [Treponema sp.]
MGKEKAIYAPGELDSVRKRLGNVSRDEAQRMSKVLGGKVGVERTAASKAAHMVPSKTAGAKTTNSSGAGSRSSSGPKIPKHRIELASDESSLLKNHSDSNIGIKNPDDDPSKAVRQSYIERLKMDDLAFKPDFDIKNLSQVVLSLCSFITRPADLVAPVFVTKRMNEYYKVLETLVISTRTLCPRNNLKRNEQIRKSSPFAYAVLDVIRYWNIARIASDMAKMQAHPRNVMVKDFTDILQAIYKPLFILENLNMDKHIKGSYKLLYKQLFIENPMDANKYQTLVKNSLFAFIMLRKDIHFRLYPLLMKLVSNKCIPYERFFVERKNCIMALLNVKESDRIAPVDVLAPPKQKFQHGEKAQSGTSDESAQIDAKNELEEVRRQALETEKKILEKGLSNLEIMFPEAGWDKLPDYPDLYPYFRGLLQMTKGYELMAPTDPMLQLSILARIIEELLIGMRSITFTPISGSEGGGKLDAEMADLINNWHDYVEDSLDKEYVPRLSEYCQVVSEFAGARTSPFARRILDEMYFVKRLYFFPHLHYAAQNSTTANAFQKKEVTPLYRQVRTLRTNLALVYGEIEKAVKASDTDTKAECEGIANPWKPYVFQVAGPISKRLDMLLGQQKRHNASLLLFTLSITTVLDYFLSNAHSWAYNPPATLVFRSIEGKGVVPQFGVDEKIDADAIFKRAIKERAAKKA